MPKITNESFFESKCMIVLDELVMVPKMLNCLFFFLKFLGSDIFGLSSPHQNPNRNKSGDWNRHNQADTTDHGPDYFGRK